MYLDALRSARTQGSTQHPTGEPRRKGMLVFHAVLIMQGMCNLFESAARRRGSAISGGSRCWSRKYLLSHLSDKSIIVLSRKSGVFPAIWGTKIQINLTRTRNKTVSKENSQLFWENRPC